MRNDPFISFNHIQERTLAASRLIFVIMMTCVGVALAQVVGRFMPGSSAALLPVWCGFLALEGQYSHHRSRMLSGRGRWLYHFSEWVFLIVILKAVQYAYQPGRFAQDFAAWNTVLESVFTTGFFLLIIVTALVWYFSLAFSIDMHNLHLDRADMEIENFELIERGRRAVREQMLERILIAGAFVVLAAIIVRTDLPGDLGARPALQAPVINVIVYFVLMLLMISMTQFDALRSVWAFHKTPIIPGLGGTWLRYGAIFLAVIGLLAFLLPTRFTLGFLEALNVAITWAGQAIYVLFAVTLLPFLLLIQRVMSLFGVQTDVVQMPETIRPPDLPVAPGGSEPLPWFEALKAVLFWMLLVGGTGFLVVYFLKSNAALWSTLTAFPLFRWLQKVLGGLTGWLAVVRDRTGAWAEAARERSAARRRLLAAKRELRRVSFADLPPREKVLFFYLNLLERGEAHGLRRKPAQTPGQYTRALQNSLPEVDEELNELTGAFLEARYSRHEIGEEKAGSAQSLWKRVLGALRGRRG